MSKATQRQRVFSFEFFPPRNAEARSRLQHSQARLAKLHPDFFFGDLRRGRQQRGSSRMRRPLTSAPTTGIEAAPHLSCVGSTKQDIRAILKRYQETGMRRIVALRGDLPSGLSGFSELRYASELVGFIRQETGDHFHIEVAAYPEFHPQASSAQSDLENFRRKVEAGADGAITQYFYNPYAYYRFLDSCEKLGVAVPIVPGIMPITNCTQLGAFLGELRGRNPALDTEAAARVRRRPAVDTRLRGGRKHRAVPSLAGERRARAALLHPEPVDRHRGDMETSGDPDKTRSRDPLPSKPTNKTSKEKGKENWRRERDSNPRYGNEPYTPLAGERLQPLGHLSADHQNSKPGRQAEAQTRAETQAAHPAYNIKTGPP